MFTFIQWLSLILHVDGETSQQCQKLEHFFSINHSKQSSGFLLKSFKNFPSLIYLSGRDWLSQGGVKQEISLESLCKHEKARSIITTTLEGHWILSGLAQCQSGRINDRCKQSDPHLKSSVRTLLLVPISQDSPQTNSSFDTFSRLEQSLFKTNWNLILNICISLLTIIFSGILFLLKTLLMKKRNLSFNPKSKAGGRNPCKAS